MNRRQKIVTTIGSLLFCYFLLFPPGTYKGYSTTAGYYGFSPNRADQAAVLVAIVILTGLVVLLLKRKSGPRIVNAEPVHDELVKPV